jgi:hypothetical protein
VACVGRFPRVSPGRAVCGRDFSFVPCGLCLGSRFCGPAGTAAVCGRDLSESCVAWAGARVRESARACFCVARARAGVCASPPLAPHPPLNLSQGSIRTGKRAGKTRARVFAHARARVPVRILACVRYFAEKLVLGHGTIVQFSPFSKGAGSTQPNQYLGVNLHPAVRSKPVRRKCSGARSTVCIRHSAAQHANRIRRPGATAGCGLRAASLRRSGCGAAAAEPRQAVQPRAAGARSPQPSRATATIRAPTASDSQASQPFRPRARQSVRLLASHLSATEYGPVRPGAAQRSRRGAAQPGPGAGGSLEPKEALEPRLLGRGRGGGGGGRLLRGRRRRGGGWRLG